jgi:hypothetical protein
MTFVSLTLIFLGEAIWAYIIDIGEVLMVMRRSVLASLFAMGGTFIGYTILKYLDQGDFKWFTMLIASGGIGVGTFGVAERRPKFLWTWFRKKQRKKPIQRFGLEKWFFKRK